MTHPLFPSLVIFCPLIPQTLGHFTPYYIKISHQDEFSLGARALCSQNTHRLSKSGKWQFLQRGRIGCKDRWQHGSTKRDLTNSQWFISVPFLHHKFAYHIIMLFHISPILSSIFSNCTSFFFSPPYIPLKKSLSVDVSGSPPLSFIDIGIQVDFLDKFSPRFFFLKGRAVYLIK